MKGLLKRLLGGRNTDEAEAPERRRPLYIPDRVVPPARPKAPPKTANQNPERPGEKPDELQLSDPSDQPTKAPSGFDPYNTGAFNRSNSWEKISKQRDR